VSQEDDQLPDDPDRGAGLHPICDSRRAGATSHDGAADDQLPDGPGGQDDPGWTEEDDDRTAETLGWLRAKRKAHRRQQRRDTAVLIYCALLAVIGYGSGLVVHFLRELEHGAHYGNAAVDLQRSIPALFCTVTAAVALLAARDALWRGPVVLPGPSVGWLLAQPVRRAAVLRPRYWQSAGIALIPGVLIGVAGAVVLRVTGLASIGAALLAAVPAALCLPALAVALGMAVERRPELTRTVRRFSAPVVLLMAALGAQTVLAGAGHRVPVLERIELWSGPWGWAAQPEVRAVGGSVPGWPAAVALLVLATAAAAWHGHRDAGRVPTTQLRARAATASTVSAAMYSMELRTVKLAMVDAGGDLPAHRLRLPPPRAGRYGKYLVVVWRDLLTLLRTPGRLGKAAVWTACAAGTASLGVDLGGERRPVGLLLGLLFGYFAVGALAEPARLETDDVRRSAWSPFRFRTLMLQHGVVPLVLGAALGVIAAIPFAVQGSPWTLLLMPLCAAPFTTASLFGACRGPARTQLLFIGGATPMGGPGPFLFMAWYAAGPLISVGGLTFALTSVLNHPLTAGAVAQTALAAFALSALLTLMTTFSADRLIRHG
jgi:hypothetical protein